VTFGIAFVCPHYAGIVTDRLLSGDSSLDDSDKCGSVTYVDGRFAYTFAGLAEVARYKFQTRQQLARALCEAGRPAQAGGPPVGTLEALDRVAQQLTAVTASMRVTPRDKRVSILLAGFRQSAEDMPVGEIHLISNFEHLSEPASDIARPAFSVGSVAVSGKLVSWIGSADLNQTARTAVLDLLQDSRVVPQTEVIKALVDEIRAASDKDPTSIGKRCSTIIVLREPSPFLVDYYTDQPVDKVDATANVVAMYGNIEAFFIIDQRLADVRFQGEAVTTRVPAVHKRQACPCKSGRQYKNCHGNTRAVHQIDSYRLSGRSTVLATPEDGSPMTFVSNEMMKGF